MVRKWTVLGGCLVAWATATAPVNAGWGSWGGSYGSYGSYGASHGSWGSSGDSSGSWGSRGVSLASYGSQGGPIRRLLRRVHARHAVRRVANYGSWGSSHGSWGGSYGSHGSWGGSYGSHGSWGSYGSTGTVYQVIDACDGAVLEGPTAPMQTEPASPSDSGSSGGDGSATESPGPEQGFSEPGRESDNQANAHASPAAGRAVIRVSVPESAQLFVNGHKTRSTGANRRFVSEGLRPGRSYRYTLRAVLLRAGRPVERTKQVVLRAEQTSDVRFAFEQPADDPATVQTALTLYVPDGAEVRLSGKPTRSSGSVRRFATDAIAAGEKWADYVVEVALDRDGKRMTQRRTVTLRGGDNVQMRFDFEGPTDSVAQR